jgi:hypothetical protein
VQDHLAIEGTESTLSLARLGMKFCEARRRLCKGGSELLSQGLERFKPGLMVGERERPETIGQHKTHLKGEELARLRTNHVHTSRLVSNTNQRLGTLNQALGGRETRRKLVCLNRGKGRLKLRHLLFSA